MPCNLSHRVVMCAQAALPSGNPLALVAIAVPVVHAAIPMAFVVHEVASVDLIWRQHSAARYQVLQCSLAQSLYGSTLHIEHGGRTCGVVTDPVSFPAALDPLSIILQPGRRETRIAGLIQ